MTHFMGRRANSMQCYFEFDNVWMVNSADKRNGILQSEDGIPRQRERRERLVAPNVPWHRSDACIYVYVKSETIIRSAAVPPRQQSKQVVRRTTELPIFCICEVTMHLMVIASNEHGASAFYHGKVQSVSQSNVGRVWRRPQGAQPRRRRRQHTAYMFQ